MMKHLAILILSLFFFGCGRDDDKEQETDDSITGEQVQSLTNLRSSTQQWAVKCEHNGRMYVCEEGSDGDSAVWIGAMCISGDTAQCMNIPLLINSQGQPFRSPARKDVDTSNEFSRDMLLGVLAYLVKTKDTFVAQKLLSYIEDNDYQLCNNPSDNRCDVNPTQYRAVWGLMKRIWEHMGLQPTQDMRNGDFGDDTIIKLQSEFTPGGFTLHLVAFEIFLRNQLHTNTDTIQSAANNIADRQYENPFFEYVARGRTSRAADLALQRCPTQRPARAHQWAWQRDQREQAWLNSMGWDCIFISNLLIGDWM